MKNPDNMQATDWLRPALLLSPEELVQELGTARNAPALERHALHVELSEPELRRLESAVLPQGAQMGLLTNDAGVRVVLLAVQSAGLQHRFIVPIVGTRERAWLRECVDHRSVLVSVDAHETDQLALVSVRFDPREHGPELVRRCEAPVVPHQIQMARELASLVVTLREPGRVASAVELFAVEEATVFVVLPRLPNPEPGSQRLVASSSVH